MNSLRSDPIRSSWSMNSLRSDPIPIHPPPHRISPRRHRRDGGERLDQQLPGGHPGRGGRRGGHLRRLLLLGVRARGRRRAGRGEEAGQVVAHAAGARPLQPGPLLRGGGHLRIRRDRPLQDLLGPHLGDEERNTRLENMSWRIWNLARKKKQLPSATSLARSTQTLQKSGRLVECLTLCLASGRKLFAICILRQTSTMMMRSMPCLRRSNFLIQVGKVTGKRWKSESEKGPLCARPSLHPSVLPSFPWSREHCWTAPSLSCIGGVAPFLPALNMNFWQSSLAKHQPTIDPSLHLTLL